MRRYTIVIVIFLTLIVCYLLAWFLLPIKIRSLNGADIIAVICNSENSCELAKISNEGVITDQRGSKISNSDFSSISIIKKGNKPISKSLIFDYNFESPDTVSIGLVNYSKTSIPSYFDKLINHLLDEFRLGFYISLDPLESSIVSGSEFNNKQRFNAIKNSINWDSKLPLFAILDTFYDDEEEFRGMALAIPLNKDIFSEIPVGGVIGNDQLITNPYIFIHELLHLVGFNHTFIDEEYGEINNLVGRFSSHCIQYTYLQDLDSRINDSSPNIAMSINQSFPITDYAKLCLGEDTYIYNPYLVKVLALYSVNKGMVDSISVNSIELEAKYILENSLQKNYNSGLRRLFISEYEVYSLEALEPYLSLKKDEWKNIYISQRIDNLKQLRRANFCRVLSLKTEGKFPIDSLRNNKDIIKALKYLNSDYTYSSDIEPIGVETTPEILTIEELVINERHARFPGCEEDTLSESEKNNCAKSKMEEFIYNNLDYPRSAISYGVEGTVFIRIVVKKNGSVEVLEVIDDIGYGCGAAAKKVVERMDRWTPAILKGEAIDYPMQIPIVFKLY